MTGFMSHTLCHLFRGSFRCVFTSSCVSMPTVATDVRKRAEYDEGGLGEQGQNAVHVREQHGRPVLQSPSLEEDSRGKGHTN